MGLLPMLSDPARNALAELVSYFAVFQFRGDSGVELLSHVVNDEPTDPFAANGVAHIADDDL